MPPPVITLGGIQQHVLTACASTLTQADYIYEVSGADNVLIANTGDRMKVRAALASVQQLGPRHLHADGRP
jgi:hypothetical protein